MNVDFYLPKPTDDELNNGKKLEYYERIKSMDLEKKYKISKNELNSWMYHNYNAVYLLEEELSLLSYKELKMK